MISSLQCSSTHVYASIYNTYFYKFDDVILDDDVLLSSIFSITSGSY